MRRAKTKGKITPSVNFPTAQRREVHLYEYTLPIGLRKSQRHSRPQIHVSQYQEFAKICSTLVGRLEPSEGSLAPVHTYTPRWLHSQRHVCMPIMSQEIGGRAVASRGQTPLNYPTRFFLRRYIRRFSALFFHWRAKPYV